MKLVNNREMSLLRSVLDAERFEGALFRGTKGEHFVDTQVGSAWDFVLDHWAEYGKIPAHETVFEFFPNLTKELVKTNPQEPPDFYAKSILEAYVQRNFVDDMLKILPDIELDPAETLEAVSKSVAKHNIIREGIDMLNLHNTARERYDDYYRQEVMGIKFGWPTLDAVTLGAHRGELIGFVARGGQGKTWTLLYNALHAWKASKRVLMIATEVPPLRMLQRMDALNLGCDYNIFRKQLLPTETEEQYKKLLFDGDQERNEAFMIVHGYGLNPSAINVLIEHHKPDIVFVDGVYLLESDAKYGSGADWQKVRYLANEMKHKVARANNIPVVFNTQFSRSVGTAVGKSKKVEGGVEDIGYGDEFGKACDLLVSIYRTQEDMDDRMLAMKVIKGREIKDNLEWRINFDFQNLSFTEIEMDTSSPFSQTDEEQAEAAYRAAHDEDSGVRGW